MRRAALLVAALTACSTALGFVRDVVVGVVFGASPELDAWFVAQGVMNLALGLISGAMARSLTPTLARQSEQCSGTSGTTQPGTTTQPDGTAQPNTTTQPDGTAQPDTTTQPDGTAQPDTKANDAHRPRHARRARHPLGARRASPHQHRTLDVAVTVTLLVLGVASLIFAVFASPVITVLAPGFAAPEHDLAVHLTRIVLIATLLVSGTNLLAGAAHAHGHFGWAGVQGVPFNIVMILAAGVFGPRYGVAALAVGFVVGSALRLAFQLVPLHQLRLRVGFSMDVRDPGFREISRMLPPLLLGSAITNVNQLVDRAVASTVGEGAISALSYGWRVVNLPETLIVASLIVPLYPAIGAAADNTPELRRLIRRATTTILATITPIMAVFVVASGPVVAALFGYGAFDADSVANAAQALRWYAPGLLMMGISTILLRASHAVGDARTPTLVALIAMGVNVAGSVILGPIFGIPGIAFATTVSLAVSAILNAVMLIRHYDAVDTRAFGQVCGRVLPAGAVSGVVAAVTRWGLSDALALPLHPILLAAVISLAALAAYLLALAAMRAPELQLLREALGRRRR